LQTRHRAGLESYTPQGAFYLFPNIKETGKTSAEITQYLLDEAHIAMAPGSVFGQYSEGYVRMSYANSYENLGRAMHSMRRALEKI
jgi:aminotransferase